MVGFQILVNQKPIYTIGIGEFGVLNAEVMFHRIQTKAGPISEDISIWGHGLKSSDSESKASVIWPRWYVEVGDEITIRIIETDKCDDGEPLEPLPPKNSQN